MGLRQIRYCDITGSETDVEHHEIHIDQMRVEIDLAEREYRRLLGALRPFIDAGRVDAAVPDSGSLPGEDGSRRRVGKRPSTSSGLTAEEREQLRQWAEANDIAVPSNNRFKQSLIAQWRADTAPAAPEATTDPAQDDAPDGLFDADAGDLDDADDADDAGDTGGGADDADDTADQAAPVG